MQKAKDILKEMGFNEKAPESLKKAFLKHLQSTSQPNNIVSVAPHKKQEEHQPQLEQQLEFDFKAAAGDED